MRNDRFFPLELALLLALAVTLVWGAASLGRQQALSERMIRLHVVADSDEPAAQALKLQVRDRVLEQAEAVLSGVTDRGAAEAALASALPRLEQAARREVAARGFVWDVKVSLERAAFPTRDYGSFALPAGEYESLRITLGAGEGKNWWCVVFPPLCTAEALSGEAAETLSRQDRALITREDGEYEIRFRILELWDLVREKLE